MHITLTIIGIVVGVAAAGQPPRADRAFWSDWEFESAAEEFMNEGSDYYVDGEWSLVSASDCESCGRPEIQPLGRRELNDDGTIKGLGVTHNTQGIVAGEDAKPHSIPWQVMVSENGALCGGSLIDCDWVVTAAHCAVNHASPSDFRLVFGGHNVNTAEGTQIVRPMAPLLTMF